MIAKIQQTGEREKAVREVVRVLSSVVELPLPEEFRVGAMVMSRGCYGVVTGVEESDLCERPLTILWDATKEEAAWEFAYTWDEVRVHQISVLSPYRPGQTGAIFPSVTKLELAGGEMIELSAESVGWVESMDSTHITIRHHEVLYRFPLSAFPAIPFQNKITLSPSCGELSVTDLRTRAEIWLSCHSPPHLLEIVTPAWQEGLKAGFMAQLDRAYETADLDTAWEMAFASFLEQQGKEEGMGGFKVGSRLLQRRGEGERWGVIVSLDPYAARSLEIAWEDGEKMRYSRLEMQVMGVLRVSSVVLLSPNVAYQISEDGSYYRAYIAFRTKKLARVWLKSIKQKVGKLSHLHDYQRPEFRHLSGKRWEYEVEKPRHKTTKKRLEALQELASWNLEGMPG